MKDKYKWQGEPVEVIFGLCNVKSKKDRPLWWYNYECSQSAFGGNGACIPAVKVILKSGENFVLSNHFGIGVHKLLNGGWPGYVHFSLPKGKFEKSNLLKYTKFDIGSYEDHERSRRKWQSENYPNEFKELEALESLIK